MEIETTIYINDEGKPVLLEEDRPKIQSFYCERKRKWVRMNLFDDDAKRSHEANKYLWVCYGYFVPNNFETTNQVHEYFTELFLKQTSLFDIDTEHLQTEIERLKKGVRRIISVKEINNKMEIIWVKSTAILNKKEFADYIESVKREGNLLGIEFPEK